MTTILRLPTVKERTGLSRSSIYAFVARGTFPAPVSVGARAVGWNSASVEAWITGRIEQSQLTEQTRGKKAEVTSPVVQGNLERSTTSDTARFARTSLHMGMGLKARRGQL